MATAEFDLQEHAREKLTYVPGADPYHEFVSAHEYAGSMFRVFWDLDQQDDHFGVLDVSIVQESLDIDKNPE